MNPNQFVSPKRKRSRTTSNDVDNNNQTRVTIPQDIIRREAIEFSDAPVPIRITRQELAEFREVRRKVPTSRKLDPEFQRAYEEEVKRDEEEVREVEEEKVQEGQQEEEIRMFKSFEENLIEDNGDEDDVAGIGFKWNPTKKFLNMKKPWRWITLERHCQSFIDKLTQLCLSQLTRSNTINDIVRETFDFINKFEKGEIDTSFIWNEIGKIVEIEISRFEDLLNYQYRDLCKPIVILNLLVIQNKMRRNALWSKLIDLRRPFLRTQIIQMINEKHKLIQNLYTLNSKIRIINTELEAYLIKSLEERVQMTEEDRQRLTSMENNYEITTSKKLELETSLFKIYDHVENFLRTIPNVTTSVDEMYQFIDRYDNYWNSNFNLFIEVRDTLIYDNDDVTFFVDSEQNVPFFSRNDIDFKADTGYKINSLLVELSKKLNNDLNSVPEILKRSSTLDNIYKNIITYLYFMTKVGADENGVQFEVDPYHDEFFKLFGITWRNLWEELSTKLPFSALIELEQLGDVDERVANCFAVMLTKAYVQSLYIDEIKSFLSQELEHLLIKTKVILSPKILDFLRLLLKFYEDLKELMIIDIDDTGNISRENRWVKMMQSKKYCLRGVDPTGNSCELKFLKCALMGKLINKPSQIDKNIASISFNDNIKAGLSILNEFRDNNNSENYSRKIERVIFKVAVQRRAFRNKPKTEDDLEIKNTIPENIENLLTKPDLDYFYEKYFEANVEIVDPQEVKILMSQDINLATDFAKGKLDNAIEMIWKRNLSRYSNDPDENMDLEIFFDRLCVVQFNIQIYFNAGSWMNQEKKHDWLQSIPTYEIHGNKRQNLAKYGVIYPTVTQTLCLWEVVFQAYYYDQYNLFTNMTVVKRREMIYIEFLRQSEELRNFVVSGNLLGVLEEVKNNGIVNNKNERLPGMEFNIYFFERGTANTPPNMGIRFTILLKDAHASILESNHNLALNLFEKKDVLELRARKSNQVYKLQPSEAVDDDKDPFVKHENWVLDIETYPINGLMKMYLAVVVNLDDPEKKKFIYWGDKSQEQLVDLFVVFAQENKLLDVKKKKKNKKEIVTKHYVWTFNGFGFDIQVFLADMIKVIGSRSIKGGPSQIKSASFGNLTFMDYFKIYGHGSLQKQYDQTIKGPLKKDDIPHHLINPNTVEGYKDRLIKYCIGDCMMLRELVIAHMKICKEVGISKYVESAAQMGIALLRRYIGVKYTDPNTGEVFDATGTIYGIPEHLYPIIRTTYFGGLSVMWFKKQKIILEELYANLREENPDISDDEIRKHLLIFVSRFKKQPPYEFGDDIDLNDPILRSQDYPTGTITPFKKFDPELDKKIGKIIENPNETISFVIDEIRSSIKKGQSMINIEKDPFPTPFFGIGCEDLDPLNIEDLPPEYQRLVHILLKYPDWKPDQLSESIYGDVNSLYPSVMDGKIPLSIQSMGPCSITYDRTKNHSSMEYAKLFDPCSLYYVVGYKYHDDYLYPCIPQRPLEPNKPLEYPRSSGGDLGRYMWGIELKTLLEFDAFEYLVVSNKITYKSGNPFTGFVRDSYQKRVDAKAAGNSALEKMIKTCMNSCYGKTGQRLFRLLIYCTLQELGYQLSTYEKTDYITLVKEVQDGIWTVEFDDVNYSSQIGGLTSIASFICAAARMKTMTFILRGTNKGTEPHAAYTDTDSAVVSLKHFDWKAVEDLMDDSKLGCWKVEHRGGSIKIYAPKCYVLKCVDGCPCKKKVTIKCKGVKDPTLEMMDQLEKNGFFLVTEIPFWKKGLQVLIKETQKRILDPCKPGVAEKAEIALKQYTEKKNLEKARKTLGMIVEEEKEEEIQYEKDQDLSLINNNNNNNNQINISIGKSQKMLECPESLVRAIEEKKIRYKTFEQLKKYVNENHPEFVILQLAIDIVEIEFQKMDSVENEYPYINPSFFTYKTNPQTNKITFTMVGEDLSFNTILAEGVSSGEESNLFKLLCDISQKNYSNFEWSI